MQKLTGTFYYQLFGIVMIIGAVLLVGRYVPVASTLADVEHKIASAGQAAPVAYPLLIAACNLLLLPAGILSVGGGFFFGLWWGFALVLTGNVAGAAAAFFLGRKLGRKRIERLLRHRSKWVHLDEAIEREGWKIIVLSQLHPLFPVSLINYIYGITRIRFWPCLWWTVVGRAPGIFLYVYLGTLGQFGLNLARGKNRPAFEEYLFWIGGLLVIFLLTAALGRLALRLLKEAEEKAEKASPEPPPPKIGAWKQRPLESAVRGEDDPGLLEFPRAASAPPLPAE